MNIALGTNNHNNLNNNNACNSIEVLRPDNNTHFAESMRRNLHNILDPTPSPRPEPWISAEEYQELELILKESSRIHFQAQEQVLENKIASEFQLEIENFEKYGSQYTFNYMIPINNDIGHECENVQLYAENYYTTYSNPILPQTQPHDELINTIKLFDRANIRLSNFKHYHLIVSSSRDFIIALSLFADHFPNFHLR